MNDSGEERRRRRGGRLALAWVVITAPLAVVAATSWLAGWRLEVVRTPSMAGAVPAGSLAVVSPTNPQRLRAGDVVVFPDPLDQRRRLLHRVVDVQHDRPRLLVTQGDANDVADPVPVRASTVIGKLRFRVAHVGSTVDLVTAPATRAALVLVPAGVLLFGRFSRRP